MLHFQFKNKGLLVLIYGALSLFIGLISGSFLKEYFDRKYQDEVFMLCVSLSVLGAAVLLKKADNDFFIDDAGEKHEVYFDNQFMFISMKIWIWIFYVGGGLFFLIAVADALNL